MSSNERRSAGRRRAWGRGPMILRLESLEGRQLLASRAFQPPPDLVAANFSAEQQVDWGQSFHVSGDIANVGRGATRAGFRVDIYGSLTPRINQASVLLGSVDIPAGLGPKAYAHFDKDLALPSGPLYAGGQSQTVYVGLRVDAGHAIFERNERNNQNQGATLDTAAVAVTPAASAHLVGSSLLLTPNSAEWGDDLSLTMQVTNNAAGEAPPTRSRVVLTPAGVTPGGANDVTIGDIALPAVPAYQLVNTTRTITLPAEPPSALINSTDFVLSVIHDADYQTNPAVSSQVAQGVGYDQATLTIAPGTNLDVTAGHLPELAASGLTVPTTPVTWGQTIDVSATVQNLGQADAQGPVRVRFYLAGANGEIASALHLADTSIDGLKAGASEEIHQSLTLPARLSDGVVVTGDGVGKIVVQIDPEYAIDEPLRTNNIATSAPIQLRLIAADGTVTAADVASGDISPEALRRRQLQLLRAQAAGNQDNTFQKITKKVGNIFSDIGHKLSISGKSHNS